MNETTVAVIWILSFGLYLLIYTYWIPLRTQEKIESWLRSEESDETLLMSLEVITKRIREQMLVDFEEFMLLKQERIFKSSGLEQWERRLKK